MSTPKNIKFSTNWNNKLDCKCFTTIRLNNDKKYRVGEIYDIYLNEKYLGKAELIEKRKIHLQKINNFIAYLDTGYSAAKCKDMLKRMYKNTNPLLDFNLLKYV